MNTLELNRPAAWTRRSVPLHCLAPAGMLWTTSGSHANTSDSRGNAAASRGPARHAHSRPASQSISALEFARVRLGFEPDEKQTLMLSQEHYRLMLNCTRQWGKSTVTALKAVHRAWSRPGSLTLVVSPGERQSREFLRKAKSFVEDLRIKPRGDGDNPISVQLPNGSRIVGLPGKHARIRGFSAVSLLIIDEAAWVDPEQYEAVQPMLATTDGDIWMLSTPWGKKGFFWEAWMREPEWFKISVKATDCPRINPKFLESQRKRMGKAAFSREYMCEFMSTGYALFEREQFDRAVTGEIRSMWP